MCVVRCTWSCGSCCRFATVKAHTGAALCSTELTVGGCGTRPPLEPLPPCRGRGIFTVQPSPVSEPNMMCWLGRLSIVVGVAEGLKPVSYSTHTHTGRVNFWPMRRQTIGMSDACASREVLVDTAAAHEPVVLL